MIRPPKDCESSKRARDVDRDVIAAVFRRPRTFSIAGATTGQQNARLSIYFPVITMKASIPSGSPPGSPAQAPTSATDTVADGGLRATPMNDTDLRAAGKYPRSTYWADMVVDVLQFDASPPQSPRARSPDALSSATSLSTVATGPAGSASGAAHKRRVQYAKGNDDDSSRALGQCVDEGEGVAELRRQSLESFGTSRARTNAVAGDQDIALYRKFNEFFHRTELSRQERLEVIREIRQLLNAGACLPQENRGDRVLNEELLDAVRRANAWLVELLWAAGTGSGMKTSGVFNRDRALGVLFENDADVNRQLETARRLIKLGCPVDEQWPDGMTALIIAAGSGNLGAVELLLDAGANVHLTDRRGQSALMCAAKGGDRGVVEELIECEAHLDQKDRDGKTALIFAAILGHAPVVKALLAHGASIDEGDRSGQTALMFATTCDYVAVVELLLAKGANVHLTYIEGHPALSLAAAMGHAAVARLLLAYGANVHLRYLRGHTALTLAAARGDAPTVSVLLDAGADVQVEIDDGRTALELATDMGHAEVAALLVRRGARVDQ
jgi:ankyrin repeat protein